MIRYTMTICDEEVSEARWRSRRHSRTVTSADRHHVGVGPEEMHLSLALSFRIPPLATR